MRGNGKTTELVKWVNQDLGDRILVVPFQIDKQRVCRREELLPEENVVTWEEFTGDYLRGRSGKAVAIDDLDRCLSILTYTSPGTRVNVVSHSDLVVVG